MPTSIPPITTFSIDSIKSYDAELEKKMEAAEAAGDSAKAEFDEDIIQENEALILAREHPGNQQYLQQLHALQGEMYQDETRLLKANPTNGSDA